MQNAAQAAAPDADAIKHFFQASADASRREEFLAALPIYYTPCTTTALEQFLVSKVKDLIEWHRPLRSCQYRHYSRFCVVKLYHRQELVIPVINAYNTATQHLFDQIDLP